MSNFFIPDPCHENWNNMTPKEQGRHCAVCSKVVVDFTQKQETEINEIMANQTGKVCGHFKVEQLNQEAQMKVFRQPSNIFNRNWKYFAMATLGFFSLNKKAEAQTKGRVMPIRGDVAPIEQHNTNTSVTTVYGVVSQTNGKPAGGAVVVISSNGHEIARVTTIANGTYSIKIPAGKISNKQVDVVVNYSHAATKYIYALNLPRASNRLNITLDEMMMLKGEIKYIPPVENKVVPKDKEPVITEDQPTVITCRFKDEEVEKAPVKEQTQVVVKAPAVNTNTTAEVKKTFDQDTELFVVHPEQVVATIYPNPAGTSATVHCNRQTTYKVELYDEKGALKMTKAFYGNRTDLDVSGFARGHYFVKIRDDENNSNVMRLVKQ